jgi:hypothetical protein
MGKSDFFHTIPGAARRWALPSVRNASSGALRLNMKDGCGMVGENLFLEGT